ncbi:hypothetical protein Pfo_028130 [Paulownia fortunei]|nr:hypothetical protein Pfo_028130 [Paulownia fortunei]
MVKPGDVLKLHVTFGKLRANMGSVLVEAKVDDITLKDMHTIDAISMYDEKSASQVARMIHLTPSAMTTAIDKLVQKGYVERRRSRTDRRVVKLGLTHKGRVVYRAHQGFHRDMAHNLWLLRAIHPKMWYQMNELSKLMDTNDEWIYTRTGIHQRHVVTTENTSDLATSVAKKLLDKTGISPETLDFIIVSTMSPDSLSPSTAAIVQSNVGATNAFAFDLSAACSGFVYGMSVASSLLTTRYRRGLVIGAEVLSKLVDWHDRTTAVLFGDGAAGVLVERTQENVGLLAEELRTFGEKNGREVYNFATREVPEALQSALEQAKISPDDVDYYLLHQANSRIVASIAKRFKQPMSKFPINMVLNGNTSAASIGILLNDLVESGQVHAGQTIALAGFGGDAEIFDKTKEILVDQFDLEDDEVSLTTDLTNDIDADSLDLFEVLNRVEDDFDIKLAVAEDIKTVQDLVDKIKEQLAA